ncbi:hypothetical protein QN345_00625 [Cryobacterium sp. 10I1]|uniref:hypothetical protein n=1 Tax=Cryobacterium sp. 10I1 TaxID=3048578 RepID=UPI002B2355DB|nr:hypothetical protein [Cryobacterium sp. 10I1]MEB0303844.1 hypothetical protein [Cryobacterium sp. 10I1]
MTHFEDQRWTAVPSAEVMQAILDHRHDESFLARFTAKIDTRNAADADECDVWTGALSSEGYGNFRVGKHIVRAHRVAYIVKFGEVPDGLFLDHVWPVCKYRFCVNEWHLEPVNNTENTRRGRGIGSMNQRAMRSAAIIARNDYEGMRLAA